MENNIGLIKKIRNYLFGEIKASDWENAFLRARESILLGGDKITRPYSQSLWIRIAVNAIATTSSGVPLRFYNPDDSEIEDAPIVTLFEDVNESMDKYQLWEATTVYLQTTGNCIWVLAKSIGQAAKIGKSLPAAIYPLPITNFRYTLDANKTKIVGWVYRSPSGEIPFAPEEILQWKLFNPFDPFIGLSPIEILKMSMETDYSAQLTNRNLLANSAQPDGIISFESPLSETNYKRIKADWELQHKGPDNSHKIALMDSGAKYQSLMVTMRDLEFLKGRMMNREEILAFYKVPKFIAGLTDDINYATANAAHKVFWTDCIIPLLQRYEENIQSNFINRFLGGSRIYCKFDTSGIPELQDDLNQMAQTAKIFYECGIPMNQINERMNLGFEDIPGGDDPRPATTPTLSFKDKVEAIEVKQIELKPIIKGKKLELNTKEEREKYWQNLQLPAELYEKRFSATFKKIWEEMKVENLEKITANLKKYDYNGWSKNKVAEAVEKLHMEDLLFDYVMFKRQFKVKFKPLITQCLNEAAVREMEAIDMTKAFEVTDPVVIEWIEKRALELATSLSDTAKEEVKEIIKQGLREGWSTQKIADSISSYYDTSEAWKAKRVARTEVQTAMAKGQTEAYRQNPDVIGKEWIDGSPNVCDECGDRDGVIFPIDNEDIPLHPNCLCRWLPVFEEKVPEEETQE